MRRQQDLLWLSYLDAGMLRVGMGMCAWGRLKRHGTNRTLVEDFTVRALDVGLQSSHVRVHDIAMDTPARKTNTRSSARDHHTRAPSLSKSGTASILQWPLEASNGF